MKIYPSLIDRLRTQHQAIENIIREIDTARLLIRPQPGKWNIHDNIVHLAKYQPVFLERINRILHEKEPFFGRYKAEEDPEFESWRALDIATLLWQLNTDRKSLYNLLTNLTDSDLNRTGTHKKYGSLNIMHWTEFFLLHEAHHIFTIFQLAHDTELKIS